MLVRYGTGASALTSGTPRLVGPRGEETVKVRGRLSVDEMSFAGDAIASGAGIGLIPAMIFAPFPRRHVRRREVVRVLPEYGLTGGELHLVSLRDFIAAEFRPLLKACAAAHGPADAGRAKPNREKPNREKPNREKPNREKPNREKPRQKAA
jgi:DNA-binding transcriptional LysR family regulator